MIRMLIVGYIFAIRSERALCRDVQVNLAYRWFCGLSIEDKIPDHSRPAGPQRAVPRWRPIPSGVERVVEASRLCNQRGRPAAAARPSRPKIPAAACPPLGSGDGIVSAQTSALIGAEIGFATAT